MKTDKHNLIFNKVVENLRADPESTSVIQRDDLRWNYYKEIVNECASIVDHIKVWDSTLGDVIRERMKINEN